MKYGVSIDWLAFYVKFNGGTFKPVAVPNGAFAGTLDWGYRQAQHGTKQFAELWHISHACEPFAELQALPHSGILRGDSGIVKFDNRLLYTPNLWYFVDMFLSEHNISIIGLSRVDLCADFNEFKNYNCVQFVSDFLREKLRHKGRGIGASYFDHYAHKVGSYSMAKLNFTGLSFGSRQSGVRVYLYNKSFELLTVKNKPYIRDFWQNAGLDVTRDVWRLEVSITSSAKVFKDKQTGKKIEIKDSDLRVSSELVKLFHTFEKKYFAFVYNRPGITNITREPVIPLFDGFPYYLRGCIREVSTSNRTEKILIKQLWQMADKYRGGDIVQDEGATKSLALDLVKSCDLMDWFKNKSRQWSREYKK